MNYETLLLKYIAHTIYLQGEAGIEMMNTCKANKDIPYFTEAEIAELKKLQAKAEETYKDIYY